MNLLIAVVTYNRLFYTKRTLQYIWDTIQVPYYLVVVDNNSTDGTQEFLKECQKPGAIDLVILNPENYYPGKATNIAWREGLKYYQEATHLMRSDNDMVYLQGWDLEAEKYFNTIDRLGQLGLDYNGGEGKPPKKYNGVGLVEFPGVVGGPCIIKRSIWNGGIKYDESKWNGSQIQEDVKLSSKIKDIGYRVGHMDNKLSWTFADESNWKDYPDYYLKTMQDRGYDDKVEFIKTLK